MLSIDSNLIGNITDARSQGNGSEAVWKYTSPGSSPSFINQSVVFSSLHHDQGVAQRFSIRRSLCVSIELVRTLKRMQNLKLPMIQKRNWTDYISQLCHILFTVFSLSIALSNISHNQACEWSYTERITQTCDTEPGGSWTLPLCDRMIRLLWTWSADPAGVGPTNRQKISNQTINHSLINALINSNHW
jgi:hypothetical protein